MRCCLWVLVVGFLLPATGPALGQETEEPEILGAPSAWGEEALSEARVTVPGGTQLRELPDRRASTLAIVDADVELAELERRGDWVRVRYGSFRGWVWLGDGPPPAGESGWDLLTRAPGPSEPPSTPPGAASSPAAGTAEGPDPRLLERAREILGEGAMHRDLGPWTLITDVSDTKLLDSLERLAGEVVEAYRERFDLELALPGGAGTGAVKEVAILFDEEESFRSFTGSRTPVDALEPAGQAGFGVAAMARGDRTAEAVRSLFVHEVVHLLNRRSIGPRTPAWLEEGMAEALAISRIAPSGALDPEALGGSVRTRAELRGTSGQRQVAVEISGGLSLLELVRRAAAHGTLPSLEELTAERWQDLADRDVRTLRYAQSALFVRFLLDGDRRRWRPGFRGYLRGVAVGEPGEGERLPGDRLLEALGLDGWAPLEKGFEGYLRFLSRTH